ncbi:MAG: hypothetical protein IJM13_05675 [Lachnospiraceae bacterium]|nr:hypothetical protein [Lachnospiraceae bacterium]MBQ1515430.1 hypothetical protein [Lachnospiraceae bacterium]MBQ4309821.1 hypothetical protein [Lachnospiraceae bacterium]MBR0106690.1 hypothetical protein [Lachnospiraceae bacterium]MBR0401324.1 hypothetical protein [Lachnospiraceae bacterium]
MGTVYRARRNRLFGHVVKALLIVAAVMLFWGTFLWVGLDMHLPHRGTDAVISAEEEVPASAVLEAEQAFSAE